VNPGQRNLDYCRQISEKFRLFQENFEEIFSDFSGKNFRMTFFKSFAPKFQFIQKKLPFTAKFWTNYSISLEKSPLSNILLVHDKI